MIISLGKHHVKKELVSKTLSLNRVKEAPVVFRYMSYLIPPVPIAAHVQGPGRCYLCIISSGLTPI